MNSFKSLRRSKAQGGARRAAAIFVLLALVSNTFFVGAVSAQSRAESGQAQKRLSEEQRIVHVLNRLGFGARPGDVERVRRVGVERYIEEQLQPEQINDDAAQARLRSLTTLSMSTGELLAKFPNPGLLIRRLQRQGDLPAHLAAAVEQRRNGTQAPKNADANKGNTPSDTLSAPDEDKAMMMPGKEGEAGAKGDGGNAERRQYRRAIMEYMRENDLQPPQRIMAELQASRILRAVYSERQLNEVMVDFWTNHFNVFAGKGADRWLLTSYDRDVIRPNALGKFRDLLGATAKSPAMLFYLDNFQSVSANARPADRREMRRMYEMLTPEAQSEVRERLGNAARGRGGMNRRGRNREAMPRAGGVEGETPAPQRPAQQRRRRGINENYARELMELHTLGVDGGYTQRDVQEVARAFTGWTILDPRGYMAGEAAAKFIFNQRLHDDGEKSVLGQKIPSGGGMRDGETVLDILARHPSTARFIATKLCRRFVTDNPTPALVERVAQAFTKSDGDIKTTLRAVFSSTEFNSAEARRAKIKTPFEVAVSAIRALGAETNGAPQLHQWIAKMGEPLYMYQAPTGYPDRAENWVNTGALLERLNFALALVSNRIPGTRVDLARFVGDEATSSRAVNQERIVGEFLNLILQGDVSPKTKEVLLKQLSEQTDAPIVATETTGRAVERNAMQARREKQQAGATVGNPEVARIAGLILGTPEFQRQ
jgi:uncharacterized protein (DUF1800 family)